MVAVIGAGGIGSYLAAMLADAGQDVTMCVRTPFETLELEVDGETRTLPVTIATEPEAVAEEDWVVLATKAQDTASAKAWLDRLAGANTTILVAQNGIEHEERVAPIAGKARILPAIVYIAVERTEPGHVVHHGSSRMIVPECRKAAEAETLFAGSALELTRSGDFRTDAWKKLIANIAANPITALTMRRLDVFHEKQVVDLARSLLREAVLVGRCEGAEIGEADVEQVLSVYDGMTGEGGSSMLYDRLSGRSLEHDHLTGAVLRAGERHSIATPLNTAIYALVDALDRSSLRRSEAEHG
ncbi:2-dehydropantoate 2-reductase [Pararhizobium mangrovi]|uniref:2-dehydropantoate 2-reductase n=1 Tax=Pararhizobium mangrovi TaxID=2590452 RepID=A0A506U156_9HYPH|nr:2-dehydropantoate 2-reductase [Pararhizobium mangrovi]TPW26675.1 2-dehydropantoate 2-reductase [Pararhizobium mangrovi]